MSNVIVKWKNYKDMDELVEAILNDENKERIINAKALNEDIKRFSLEEISIINILNICANMGKKIYKKDLELSLNSGKKKIQTAFEDLCSKGILSIKQVHENGRIQVFYELTL